MTEPAADRAAPTGRGRHELRWALLASLALHLLILSPLLLLLREPPRARQDRLLVELYGIISNRQREARAPPAVTPAPVQHVAAASRVPGPTSPVAVRGSVSAQQAQPDAVPESMGSAEPAAAPGSSSGATGIDAQRAETLAVRDLRADELKRYLATVRNRLKANLVIPEQARRLGYEGVPVVGFTIEESGWLVPSSLHVIRSSGYADLDANALRAAQDSTPFDPPPRRIEVAVAVSFETTTR